MADWNAEVNEIFARVIVLQSPEQRRALLDQACGEDDELRASVERLLKAHNDAGSFLDHPPAGLAPSIMTGDHNAIGLADEEVSLDFLTPSDKPNCLGTLGQYEVVELVGRGGMALVLRAYDTKLNRVVAIKVMAPALASSPMAVRRFLREARAAAAVSDDHVVTIHAIHEQHKPPFIVMEFVDGKTLQDKVDTCGALEVKEILRIAMQAARGLAAAHRQGLVHRDIKPANILLENGIERVKLTDFGLARAADDVTVTQTGQIAGTPQYMSPEQAQGEPLDGRSDLFSLGSVLYTLCTGRPPFRADSAVAMLRRVSDDDPRPIVEINPEIPDWLSGIISKLLSKSPGQRFSSAEEVEQLLAQHLAHLQQPDSTPRPQPLTPEPLPPTEPSTLVSASGESAEDDGRRAPVPGIRLTPTVRVLFLLRGLVTGVCTGGLIVLLYQMFDIQDDHSGPFLFTAMFMLTGLGYRRVPREEGLGWMFLEGAVASTLALGILLVEVYGHFHDDIAVSVAIVWIAISLINIPLIRYTQRLWPPVIQGQGAGESTGFGISPRTLLVRWMVLLCLLSAAFFGGKWYLYKITHATLHIKTFDDSVVLRLSRTPWSPKEPDEQDVYHRGSGQLTVKPGKYTVLVPDRHDEFVPSPRHFELREGDVMRVTVFPTN